MTLFRALALASFALGIGLLVFVLLTGDGNSGSPPAGAFTPFAPTASPTPSEPSPSPSATATVTPDPTPVPYDGAVARLRIPRFGVDSAIEDIGILPNNQLDVPRDPLNTGWYYIYDKPGFGGNAVFAAHVDYWPDIIGPFNKLSQMEPNDEVVVVMDNGVEYTYRVFFKQRYDVETIPMGDLVNAPDKPEGAEWITLITCGGELIVGPRGGEYTDRDVVIAERVS